MNLQELQINHDTLAIQRNLDAKCMHCDSKLLRNNVVSFEDWECKHCLENGRPRTCEECCMRNTSGL